MRLGGLKEINRIDLGVGKHCRRERATISGACVDVQAIRSELRQPITQWRVAMNYQSSEIEIARQEWFSYPNEVILALLVQKNIGTNASVHVKPLPVVMKKLQPTNEFQMRFRKLRRARELVAPEACVAAIGKPGLFRNRVLSGIEQELLMVAAKANNWMT